MPEQALPAACSHCGSDDLYTTNTPANGGYGPRLLPGLGGLFSFAKFDVVLCAACGHCQFFADHQAKKKATDHSNWKRITRK